MRIPIRLISLEFAWEPQAKPDIIPLVIVLRLVYGVQSALRFSGHLDIAGELACWLKRARVDVRYSEGFNPHPRMSFAPPKPVGMSADNELVDVYVESLEPLNDYELKLDFPGALDGTPSFESMSFTYPNSIEQTTCADSVNFHRINFDFANSGWAAECVRKLHKTTYESSTDNSSGAALNSLLKRLTARRHPLVSVKSLRVLSAADFSLSHAVNTALYYAELGHDSESVAEQAYEWLTSGEWSVERKPGYKPSDMRVQALETAIEQNGRSIGVCVLGFARPNRTFSAMRVVNHCVRNYGSVPMDAVRLGFFDAESNPII